MVDTMVEEMVVAVEVDVVTKNRRGSLQIPIWWISCVMNRTDVLLCHEQDWCALRVKVEDSRKIYKKSGLYFKKFSLYMYNSKTS